MTCMVMHIHVVSAIYVQDWIVYHRLMPTMEYYRRADRLVLKYCNCISSVVPPGRWAAEFRTAVAGRGGSQPE